MREMENKPGEKFFDRKDIKVSAQILSNSVFKQEADILMLLVVFKLKMAYTEGERFIDNNGIYDKGEKFTDMYVCI